ncbi:MAG: ATP-binding cassette domain-containing protein [Bacteroidetes bacterium]|nr:ATP-binding cassette domain-containing protein [Bacteroidota bacterium]
MSEKILKALMQLFAIIARPDSNLQDRRQVVETFLKQLLNQELVDEYLKSFVEYYNIYQQKQTEGKRAKMISFSSVKVLKICTAINEELTQKQKFIVLIRLLEFIKSDSPEVAGGEYEISEQEYEFVTTVSDTFNVTEDEFNRIKAFIIYPFDRIPDSSRILIINSDKDYKHPKTKHLYSEFLRGQIRVFHVVSTNMYLMRYLGEQELYLNGQMVQQDKVFVLNIGCTIRNTKIRPIYYSNIVAAFLEDMERTKIVFDIRNVEFKFKGGKVGLHPINFAEESGTLVGIMGASGAGKTTLLNVLNGASAPTSGEVCINGFNIFTQKDNVEGLIGHVSQDDLLIEELTVFQNLYYNARLCFDNYTEQQLIDTVDNLLRNLGLFEIKNMKVGSPLNKKISGGQRKRLNISLELIREPAVLFLDEPTSGLSSRDSENIMDLLKELAFKGKLVFVVIHQPSSDIFKMFDKLIILDTGGYLIYNGNPIDSIIYFKSRIHQADWNESECTVCGNVNPEQIFNIVEASVLDEYGNPTHTRKTSPKEWQQHYKKQLESEPTKEIHVPESVPEISFKIPNKFRQWKVFTIRDVLSKLANTQYMFINILESPVLAFFLAYIIRYYNVDITNEYGYTLLSNSNLPVYIFMAVIVAIFVGLTVSAEEIIKDRLILKREAFLNLSRGSYLMSKIVILFTLSAIQALCFVLIGNSVMGIKGMYFHYWFALFSSFCFANVLGLNVSDSFKTAVTIYILIPFLVIPQMILSGIIVKFDKLNPDISSPNEIPFYGEIITARWAYEALAVHQFKDNEYEKMYYPYDKVKKTSNYKKDYWLTRLDNEISTVKRDFDDKVKKEKVTKCIDILRNEIKDEIFYNTKVKFEGDPENLYYEKLKPENIDQVKTYFTVLRQYYIKLYNNASEKEEQFNKTLQKTDKLKKEIEEKRRNYFNDNLEKLVCNNDVEDRVVEFKSHLFRKIDPIFQDPTHGFIKAHFYAPRKKLFGAYIETYWLNLGIVWFSILTLYIALYYSWLKKLLDLLERVVDKFVKPKD